MAMLAEPKRKKKWSLNPRGKQWSNDETKLGQKLLEKMGWSKGKGLGREEQGDLEPVRLKYKNDAEGVGYEAKDDQWVAHREEFNNILVSLNGNNDAVNDSDIPVKSLEVRSKSSKARVHYHKFTRGKDLSRYSATDLACILGKRAQVENPEVQSAPTSEEENGEENKVEHLHGVTTIQRGSIHEYFATKMAAVKEKQLQNAEDDQKTNFGEESFITERDNEKRVRINEDLNIVKEFCSKQKILNEKDTDEVTGEILKKKKKKSKTKELEIVTAEEESFDNLNIETKKKKKKKQVENCDSEQIEAESISNKKSKKRKAEEIVLNEIVQNGDEIVADSSKTKKKKKKSKTNDEDSFELDTHVLEQLDPSVQPPIQNGEDSTNLKKKKKKSKKEEDVQLSSEIKPNSEDELKKPKKNKNVQLSVVIPNGDIETVEEPPKKKKKKKKSEKEEEMPIVEVVVEEKKKKSKKNKTEETVVEQTQVEVVDDTRQSKKKKKKSKKEEQEIPEKYTKIDDSFVEIATKDKNVHPSDKIEENGIESAANILNEDAQQSKKKKKKSKEEEEIVPEPCNGMDESFEEIRANQKKRKRESITEANEIHSSKKMKKNDKNAEEPLITPEIENCASQEANHIKTEKKDVEISCPVQIKTEPLELNEVVIKTESTELDQSKIKRPDFAIKRKVRIMLKKIPFEKFEGSNLLSLPGYGNDLRFVAY